MVKYGSLKYGNPMYVITMFKIEHRSYKVEVLPCDICGYLVFDPVVWDIFHTWLNARKYIYK